MRDGDEVKETIRVGSRDWKLTRKEQSTTTKFPNISKRTPQTTDTRSTEVGWLEMLCALYLLFDAVHLLVFDHLMAALHFECAT